MATIIAATEFVGERPNGDRFPIHLRLASPEQRPTGEWTCAVELSGLQDDLAPIGGEDAIQSLCLALGLAHTLMRHFVKAGGKLRFADGSEGQVPLESYFGPFAATISPPAA